MTAVDDDPVLAQQDHEYSSGGYEDDPEPPPPDEPPAPPRPLRSVPSAIALYDTDAEASLLGACLLQADAALDALVAIDPSDFGDPGHGHIAHAIATLHANGDPTDPISVADHLQRHALLELACPGGIAQLIKLRSDTPATTSAPHYSRIVRDLAVLRRIQTLGAEISAMATTPGANPARAATAAQALLDQVHDQASTHEATIASVGDSAAAYLDELEQRWEHGTSGLSSGWPNLDKITGGFHPGQLITICGRPGMGKSDVATILTRNLAETVPVLVVSIEMSRQELLDRLVAAEAQVPATDLRSGQLCERDWARIGPAIGRFADLPLYLDDDPAASIASIRAGARRTGARLVAIDYMQLVDTPGAESRQMEVSAIAGGLKRMARQMEIPVVALAQLNRGVEGRADKRPMLSDLRESGTIEQESDLVIALYRDDYYNADSKDAGVLEQIVLKNRAGATGVARFAYNPARKSLGPLANTGDR